MSDKANIIAQFYNEEGVASGPPLSLPVDVNPEHLALLLNNLLGNVRTLGRQKKSVVVA
jgi:ribosome assembly protein 4